MAKKCTPDDGDIWSAVVRLEGYVGGDYDTGSQFHQLIRDGRRVAVAYRELDRPNDPTPLTDRWLAAVRGENYRYVAAELSIGVLDFEAASDDGLPDTPVTLTGQSRAVRCVLKTRGDLRRLAAALNEPLTEPT